MADIIHRVGIKAKADKVYKELASVEGVRGWWTEAVTGDSKVGGTLIFTFRSPEGEVIGEMKAKIKTLTPNKKVVWTITTGPKEWMGTSISFDLSQEDNYTILLFSHRNWKKTGEFMGHCSMKWATFLLSLRELVEKGKGKPAPNDLKIDNWN